jgi:hypothetical protein
MRRDLHVIGQICYRGVQEMVRAHAPQLEAVGQHNSLNERIKR